MQRAVRLPTYCGGITEVDGELFPTNMLLALILKTIYKLS